MLMYALQDFKIRCNILVRYPFEKCFNYALNLFKLRKFSLTMIHYNFRTRFIYNSLFLTMNLTSNIMKFVIYCKIIY